MGEQRKAAKDKDRDRQPSGHGMPAVSGLRAAAEEKLARTSPEETTGKTADAILHELQVHQIELEMQNDELKRAQVALEESRDKYLDLYDFAPVGYFTLTRTGLIVEVNLAGASMLGAGRPKLVRRGLGRFVAPEDLAQWDQHLVRVLQSAEKQTCELTLKREDGSTFYARLDSIRLDRPAQEAGDGGTGPVIRVAMSDISDRKRAEQALHGALDELEQRIKERTADLLRTVETLQEEVAERILAEQVLRKRSEELQAMARFPDENPAPVLRVDPRGTILYANRIAEEDLLSPWGVPPTGVLPASLCGEMAAALDDGRATEMEITAGARTFLLMLVPVAEAGYVNLYALDITDRKRAEERYGTILKTATDGFWLNDAQGRILEVNSALCQITGYGRKELLKMAIPDLEAAEMPEDTAEHIRQIVVAGRDRFETRHRRKDGQIIDVEVSVTYMGEPSNQFFSFVRDITDRKRAEQALRESEERFRTLVEAVTDYTYRVTVRDGRVVKTTHGPGCLPVTGYSPEEFHADPALWFQMVHPEDQPAVFDQADRLSSGQKTPPLEHRIIHKMGETRWVRNTTVPRYGNRRQYVGYEGLIQDITEHRKLQEQFAHAQKMEAIGQLAGGVAHDFRNQLTVIKGYGEMLMRRDLVKEEAKDYVRQILKAADRSAAISTQLLVFSRRETLHPKVVSINSLAGDMMKSLAQTLSEDIQLSIVPGGDLWSICVDAGQFQQTLLNLALNARDAMPQGGQLTIETENIVLDEGFVRVHAGASAGRHVVLTVRDTGTGMPPEILDHLFDPFFTTKPVGGGTGLGLAMVHGFVAQSGGFVDVQSQPGRGTTFSLYFRAVEDVAESAGRPLQAPDLPRGSGTVLVVEDEDAIRRILLETLGECGYTVLTAGNAQEAMALIESAKQKIDLLISDVVMPGWSGPELAKHFQAARPGVPVLLISGHTGKMLTEHGVVPSDVNLLVKPFSSQTLARTVRKVLGQSKRP